MCRTRPANHWPDGALLPGPADRGVNLVGSARFDLVRNGWLDERGVPLRFFILQVEGLHYFDVPSDDQLPSSGSVVPPSVGREFLSFSTIGVGPFTVMSPVESLRSEQFTAPVSVT